MDATQQKAILDEAELLALSDYSAEDEAGLLRSHANQSEKRVATEVWLAVRAIDIGIGIAEARTQADEAHASVARRR